MTLRQDDVVEQPGSSTVRDHRRFLGLTAAGYSLFHHVGSLPGGMGRVAETRWADWIDLVTPFAVLIPAVLALRAAGVSCRAWLVFVVGAIAYTQGQGIHLAANSIGNAAPGDAAHFWDETAGHAIWYGGAAVIIASLSVTMARLRRPARWGWPTALALGVSLTWWTNAIGGGTYWLSLPVAIVLVGYGWRHRATLAVLLVIGFVPAALLLTASLVHDLAA